MEGLRMSTICTVYGETYGKHIGFECPDGDIQSTYRDILKARIEFKEALQKY